MAIYKVKVVICVLVKVLQFKRIPFVIRKKILKGETENAKGSHDKDLREVKIRKTACDSKY